MKQRWQTVADELVVELAEHAARHDLDGSFVEEGYAALKDRLAFAMLVPEDLGGAGATFTETCDFIRRIAHGCGSTALAFSMHTHLVAAMVWKHRKGQPGAKLLRRVGGEGLILVSTGAGDWLESNGALERVEGGYRYTGVKAFASGSPVADVMVTSGRYEDPNDGPQVLHFPLALSAAGVRSADDWDTHGMRGTGSNTLIIEGAFIPDAAIAMRRPCGQWHPAFSVISTVAMPIFMSAYAGIAERAAEVAIASAKKRRDDPHVQYQCGEVVNLLFTVRALWRSLVDNANEFDFEPTLERASVATAGKSTLADACMRTVDAAMELAGGGAFFRKSELDRLRRDVRGASYHPLQPMRQHAFSGRIALELDPARA